MTTNMYDSIKMKLCDIKHFSFTTDIWSTNFANDLLLSFTVHWITNDFLKLSTVLNVKLHEGSHNGAHLSEQYNEISSNWNIKRN